MNSSGEAWKRHCVPLALTLFAGCTIATFALARAQAIEDEIPFASLLPTVAWEEDFWRSNDAQLLLELEPSQLAALVPEQAGLRWAACPACHAEATREPLAWSPRAPKVVTCAACGVQLPNDGFPAKVAPAPGQTPAVPEEVVEVSLNRFHHYPYHAVAPERQRYSDERIYLSARRDYAAREWLFKAALYAAARWWRQPASARDPRLARIAALIVLRAAQVYSSYAVHTDQPGRPPIFQSARVRPPFRAGYLSAKGDWLACCDVPIPLLLAYALIRDDAVIEDAGRLLGDRSPRTTIETNLFRAAALFTSSQPPECSEKEAVAARGILLAGHLLRDSSLVAAGEHRLQRLLTQCQPSVGATTIAQEELRRIEDLVRSWILPLYRPGTSHRLSPELAALLHSLDPSIAKPDR